MFRTQPVIPGAIRAPVCPWQQPRTRIRREVEETKQQGARRVSK